jgi:hypothetical protein
MHSSDRRAAKKGRRSTPSIKQHRSANQGVRPAPLHGGAYSGNRILIDSRFVKSADLTRNVSRSVAKMPPVLRTEKGSGIFGAFLGPYT